MKMWLLVLALMAPVAARADRAERIEKRGERMEKQGERREKRGEKLEQIRDRAPDHVLDPFTP